MARRTFQLCPQHLDRSSGYGKGNNSEDRETASTDADLSSSDSGAEHRAAFNREHLVQVLGVIEGRERAVDPFSQI